MSKNHSKEVKLVRLQKYIADCGVTSRRKAEELIENGHVKVNQKKITELGTKVNPEEDSVMVKGQIIDVLSVDHMYLVLNKPRGCVTTVSDPEGRKTVMDYVGGVKARVFPVGRLDYQSEGLLMLTNDGDLANMVMHPKYEVVKTYEVKVFGKINADILKKLRSGITDKGETLKPLSVRVVEQLPNKTWIEFRLNEGKNREIRRICEACGLTIDKLRRVAIGALAIDGIAPGTWSYITKAELLKLLGITKDGSKVKNAGEYVSNKKSINVRKVSKKQKEAKLADDKEFTKYRKETYQATIKLQKEIREKMKEKKAQEAKNIPIKASFEKGKKSRVFK
ncbi:MAG: rRNA pseudouridine synthase [Bacteriovoracaceae bacterium]|jgi:23S rRNA pseudouridine2605 synthase|nr:rRNA pseudouridine synthase [Bacteriovoracaceae bacterium]